jgi:hypothetical protein
MKKKERKKERREIYDILLLLILSDTVYFFDKLIDLNPLSPEIKNNVDSVKEISYPSDHLSYEDFGDLNSNQHYVLKQ